MKSEEAPGARRQVLDQRDDACFDRDVERGRRLVEDQQARVRQERHRDDDPLLLAARELMRIGAHDALRVGQAHGLDHVERALVRFLLRHLVVDQRHFHQLPADQHGRIERGHRLLIDHGDLRAADGAQLRARQRGHVAALEADRAAGDPRRRPGRSRITASATVDLPQPDSPTSPIASPGMTLQEKSITAGISPARVKNEMPRRSISRMRFGHWSRPQSRSDCSRIASASRFRPRTKDIIASAGGKGRMDEDAHERGSIP